jgi:hypothetical protein
MVFKCGVKLEYTCMRKILFVLYMFIFIVPCGVLAQEKSKVLNLILVWASP